MDSRKIAAELEKQYPKPSLHLDSPILPKVEAVMAQIVVSLRPMILPLTPRNLLRAPSAEYFEKTREALFGMPLAQLEKEQGGNNAWKGAEAPFKDVGELLKAESGPFLTGKTGRILIPPTALPRTKKLGILN